MMQLWKKQRIMKLKVSAEKGCPWSWTKP